MMKGSRNIFRVTRKLFRRAMSANSRGTICPIAFDDLHVNARTQRIVKPVDILSS